MIDHDLPAPGALRRPRTSSAGGRRLASLVRGRDGDAAWARPALLLVLAAAAVLLLWNLTENGLSNEYYAAAVKSASVSWKAWFFGSLDPGSFITVDKPPLSIWLMGLSSRVFGFGSFGMLLPQALCTVGSVALLHATVRRGLADRVSPAVSAAAGLLAAGLLALTPITVAIGRVNNPDALLILLLVASGYAVVRALEHGRTRWLVWAAVLTGLAFTTKMLQGWMVVPALGATYLVAGPPRLAVRARQLVIAGATMVAVSCAWPLAVTLWPGSKPYIGGSEDGSVWNLILGYNGLGRILGNEGGMGGGGASFGGPPGIGRMFNAQVGAQIAWLLPLAVLSLVAALWLTRRGPRTDRARAVVVLLGVWLVVHLVVFSTAKGTFHPYYTSAMAPAIAGLCGIGLVLLLQAARSSLVAHAALAVGTVGTAVLAVELLRRADDFAPWLRTAIPVLAGVAIVASVGLRGRGRAMRGLAVAAVATGALAVTLGPGSYAVANLGRALDGNNVLAGPASAGRGGFGGGMGGPGGAGGRGLGGGPPSGVRPSGASAGTQGAAAAALPPGATDDDSGATATGSAATGATASGSAASGSTASGSAASGSTVSGSTAAGSAASGSASGAEAAGAPAGGRTGGGMGRTGGGISDEVVAYLQAHQGGAKYLLAASGSQTTASVIIATGEPVVTIGGFGGSDPAPTVAQLARMVQDGELRYVLVSSGGMGRGGASASALNAWVTAHGTAVPDVTVENGTLYAVSAS
jgi:4-amino-4-deoxy-L-arabinose transferase-like glycosyltransferase